VQVTIVSLVHEKKAAREGSVQKGEDNDLGVKQFAAETQQKREDAYLGFYSNPSRLPESSDGGCGLDKKWFAIT